MTDYVFHVPRREQPGPDAGNQEKPAIVLATTQIGSDGPKAIVVAKGTMTHRIGFSNENAARQHKGYERGFSVSWIGG